MKICLFTLTVFVICTNAVAQQDYSNMSFPPPDVASLLRYIEKPVSLYNGQVGVNIPLYTAKDGTAEIPITISYNTSGIKVAEEASNIGLGWNIALGGFINQQIKGDEDDLPTKYAFNDTDQYLGDTDFIPSNLFTIPGTNESGFQEKQFPNGYFLENTSFVSLFQDHSRKYQPDIYHYSFGGLSGKFYIDQFNDSIYQEKVDPKIYFEKTKIGGKNGFKAVTPDGTTYFFNGVKGTSRPTGDARLSSISYYLSEVILPNGDVIYYTYKKLGMSRSIVMQSEKIESVFLYGGYVRTNYVTEYEVVVLEQIRTRNVTIDFQYGSRLDISGETKLESIAITGGNTVKRMFFYTSYFNATTTGNYANASTSLTDFDTKRLRLDSVAIEGIPAYRFYYNSRALPVKRSFAVDYWGFYNGQENNVTYLPKQSYLNFFSTSRFNDDGAIRAVSETHAMASTLEKIVYPMGGEMSLSYEPNTFNNHKIPSIQDLTSYGVFGFQSPGMQVQDYNLSSDRRTYMFEFTEEREVGITGQIGYGNGIWQDVEGAYIMLTKMSTATESAQNIFSWYYAPPNEGKFEFKGKLAPGRYIVNTYLPDELGEQLKPFPQPGEIINCVAKANVYIIPVASDLAYSKGGGIRVSKVVNTAIESTSVVKQFIYSPGKLMSPLRFTESVEFHVSIGPNNDAVCGTYYTERWDTGTITSSESHYPVSYNAMGSLVGYSKVKEYRVLDANLANKEYVEYEYHNEASLGHPSYVPEPPALMNGLLLSEKYVNNENIVLKSIEYRYSSTDQHKFFGIAHYDKWRGPTIGGCDLFYGMRPERFLISFYLLPSRLVKPYKITETTQGISREKNILYNRFGLVKLETDKITNSKTITTTTIYNNNTSLPDHAERYVINNLPTDRITFINGIQDKKNVYTFSKIGESLYPGSSIKIPHYNILNHKTYLTSSAIPTEVSYSYIFNKITEVKNSAGPPRVYLWGYKGTRIVGEAVGLTMFEVQNLIDQSGCGLSFNDSPFSDYDNSQSTLISRFATLRNSMPASTRLTSFTYDMLNGILTITDPNNSSTFYNYDSVGRLNQVKEDSGSIISAYRYHYKSN
jgi:hypothetical protein